MSTTGYAPPMRLDGPPPLPPKYGLVQSGTIVPPPADAGGAEDPHWLNGAAIYPWPPECATAYNQCGVDRGGELSVTINDSKAAGETPPLPIFAAFPVYEPISCQSATVGSDAQGWFENRAKVALAAVESQAVEAEFALGAHLPNNPHLCDANLIVLTLTAGVSPVEGLGMLEDAIATTCRQGVIHCDVLTATSWIANSLVIDDHGKLRTFLGTLVIPGQGYRGAEPDQSDLPALTDCSSWAFATGPVEIRRGDIFTSPDTYGQALDRSSNFVTFRAERYYLVTWDTVLQVGVLIDRDLEGCDLPGS